MNFLQQKPQTIICPVPQHIIIFNLTHRSQTQRTKKPTENVDIKLNTNTKQTPSLRTQFPTSIKLIQKVVNNAKLSSHENNFQRRPGARL